MFNATLKEALSTALVEKYISPEMFLKDKRSFFAKI